MQAGTGAGTEISEKRSAKTVENRAKGDITMHTHKRWINKIFETAETSSFIMPWTRGARRAKWKTQHAAK